MTKRKILEANLVPIVSHFCGTLLPWKLYKMKDSSRAVPCSKKSSRNTEISNQNQPLAGWFETLQRTSLAHGKCQKRLKMLCWKPPSALPTPSKTRKSHFRAPNFGEKMFEIFGARKWDFLGFEGVDRGNGSLQQSIFWRFWHFPGARDVLWSSYDKIRTKYFFEFFDFFTHFYTFFDGFGSILELKSSFLECFS